MKSIRTARGSFLTGSEIADAVTAYGLALARMRALDVVDVPYLANDGSVHRAQFRIGWLIETVVTHDQRRTDDLTDELIDVGTIFDLLGKASSITASRKRGEWSEAADGVNWDEII